MEGPQPTPRCFDCRIAYADINNVLRCRISPSSLECSVALAEDCTKYEREPGADAEEVRWNRMNLCRLF